MVDGFVLHHKGLSFDPRTGQKIEFTSTPVDPENMEDDDNADELGESGGM